MPIVVCPILAESSLVVKGRQGIIPGDNGTLTLRSTGEPLLRMAELREVADDCGATLAVDPLLLQHNDGPKKGEWVRKANELYENCACQGHTHVVWVSHRESFRDLLKVKRFRIPYCGVALLCRTTSGTWSIVEQSW
jgi:hypothetical protein